MKTVIAANLPFRTLKHPRFHHLLNLLRPNTHIPSPTTIRRSIHKYGKEVHQKLKKALPEDTFLHLATDCWTSPNKLAFMGTTLHYMDQNWKLCQFTVGFQYLGGEAHSASYLGNKLSQLIREFGITNRVLAVVSDNASVNIALAKHLQANVFGPKWDPLQYRLPCLAHVIALVSNQFMRVLKSNPDNNEKSSSTPAIECSIKALQNYPPSTFAWSVCKVRYFAGVASRNGIC